MAALRGNMAALVGVAAAQHLFVSLLVVLFSSCSATSTLSSFWQQELPRAPMPSAFAKLASPLSELSTQNYLAALHADALTSTNTDFCSSAGIYCPTKDVVVFGGPEPAACVPPFLYIYGELPCPDSAADMASAVKASSAMFFTPASLSLSKVVTLPNTANDLNGLRFLPDTLAMALPELTEQSMPELAKFYGVKAGSDMDSAMKVSLAHCGYNSEHELKTCALSGESMVSFIASTVGDDAAVYTPPVVSMQKATVMGISVAGAKGSKIASCHDMEFPSLLYSCHMTQTAELMDATLKLADGKLVQMPAVCHMDTSYWNPSHIAFKILKTAPGKGPVCHWFPENSFIFVQGAS